LTQIDKTHLTYANVASGRSAVDIDDNKEKQSSYRIKRGLWINNISLMSISLFRILEKVKVKLKMKQRDSQHMSKAKKSKKSKKANKGLYYCRWGVIILD
jgi:hypothetical protein